MIFRDPAYVQTTPGDVSLEIVFRQMPDVMDIMTVEMEQMSWTVLNSRGNVECSTTLLIGKVIDTLQIFSQSQ